ncbi:GNAT family N-acetyltransferase [Nocardia sp. NPDC020380]|uniref:GNAT family N-acetyltransferase n=1 Tax=Nocardia sp. NPDC020380 TaxID=3364309 RepID=UPI0037997479
MPPADCTLGPRLLTGLANNHGFVFGARIGSELVGFAYGFPCLPDSWTPPYLYLQLIVVHPEHQGNRIGRTMMGALADFALARGLLTVRWAFDPVDTRNAHFYLDVIGAAAQQFVPDMYGAAADAPTDRVIAEWDLTDYAGPTILHAPRGASTC